LSLALGPSIRWAREQRHSRSRVLGILGIALLILLVAFATGIGGSVTQRVLNFATLDYRAAMWAAILGDWGNHPLNGTGPGSFPWLLQLTPYFDTNSWAPRHPDSAVMQSLAEGGLMGLGAIAVLVAVIGKRLAQAGSGEATWALVAFAITCLLASPTDFGFVVVVAIAWVAYALPRGLPAAASRVEQRLRPAALASFACLAIIGVAYGTSAVAMVSYERARVALASGLRAGVEPALDLAVGLDPGMAIYRRERGVLRLQEAAPGAVNDLEVAVRLNPADDLAWRSLAIAKLSEGNAADAESALSNAVELQRSDPTNLLLNARFERLQGRTDSAGSLIAEIIQAWPTTVFAPGWEPAALSELSTADAVERAIERWTTGAESPEPADVQGIWLAVLGGLDGGRVSMAVGDSGLGETLGGAFALAIACEPPETPFDEMAGSERRSYLYWWLRARSDGTAENPEPAAARMATLMGRPLPTEVDSRGLNPLNENGAFSADRWGYRRTSVEWLDAPLGLVLPSPSEGLAKWLLNPEAAVRIAGLEAELPMCLLGTS
jgi:tetratricopeptide (TPR) repeat protein